MKTEKKKLLVVPPGAACYESPLLAIPSFFAYLGQRGVENVFQDDYSLGFFE